jgi:hypothetical protein
MKMLRLYMSAEEIRAAVAAKKRARGSRKRTGRR